MLSAIQARLSFALRHRPKWRHTCGLRFPDLRDGNPCESQPAWTLPGIAMPACSHAKTWSRNVRSRCSQRWGSERDAAVVWPMRGHFLHWQDRQSRHRSRWRRFQCRPHLDTFSRTNRRWNGRNRLPCRRGLLRVRRRGDRQRRRVPLVYECSPSGRCRRKSASVILVLCFRCRGPAASRGFRSQWTIRRQPPWLRFFPRRLCRPSTESLVSRRWQPRRPRFRNLFL